MTTESNDLIMTRSRHCPGRNLGKEASTHQARMMWSRIISWNNYVLTTSHMKSVSYRDTKSKQELVWWLSQVEVLMNRTDHLSLVIRSHKVAGENQLPRVVLCPLYLVCTGVHTKSNRTRIIFGGYKYGSWMKVCWMEVKRQHFSSLPVCPVSEAKLLPQ